MTQRWEKRRRKSLYIYAQYNLLLKFGKYFVSAKMSTSSFLNTVSDFKERTNQVKIAVTLSRSNHIVQSTIRAIFSQLQQQGLTIIGSVDKNDVLEICMPIIRDIINSLITVGYFAVVIDKNNKPKIIDPELYIVVPPS